MWNEASVPPDDILGDEAWQPEQWSFWELPLGTHSLLQRNSAPELRRSEGYGRRCPHCLICSVGGKSFSRVPTPELITLSEPSRPV